MSSLRIFTTFVVFVVVATQMMLLSVHAFVPSSVNRRAVVTTKQMLVAFPATDLTTTTSLQPITLDQSSSSLYEYYNYQPSSSSSTLNDGIQAYVAKESSSTSSTSLLSLQEIKKVSQEEIDQKKFTFNLIFWGGGIVAPFIATVFYFGFKFWEK